MKTDEQLIWEAYSMICESSIPRILFFDYKGERVEVIKNATKKEQKDLMSDGMIGVVIDVINQDVYYFNRYKASHGAVLDNLGLRENTISGLFYPEQSMDDYPEFLVTDATGKKYQNNPDTPKIINDVFGYININYFNEAIVGDWEEIEENDEN